jgi:hypothetical protein
MQVDPAPPAAPNGVPETAEALFSSLLRQRAAGRFSLRLDYGRLTHIDSPVGVEADGNLFAYGLLVVVGLAWWLGGWQWAVGLAALGTLVYFTLGRAYMHRRVKRRVETQALIDLGLWRKLWSFGGVTLIETGSGSEFAAPKDNWMALVRKLQTEG